MGSSRIAVSPTFVRYLSQNYLVRNFAIEFRRSHGRNIVYHRWNGLVRHGSLCPGVRNVNLSSVMKNKAALQARGGGGGRSLRIWLSSYRKVKSRGAEEDKEKQQRSSSRITKTNSCRGCNNQGTKRNVVTLFDDRPTIQTSRQEHEVDKGEDQCVQRICAIIILLTMSSVWNLSRNIHPTSNRAACRATVHIARPTS